MIYFRTLYFSSKQSIIRFKMYKNCDLSLSQPHALLNPASLSSMCRQRLNKKKSIKSYNCKISPKKGKSRMECLSETEAVPAASRKSVS